MCCFLCMCKWQRYICVCCLGTHGFGANASSENAKRKSPKTTLWNTHCFKYEQWLAWRDGKIYFCGCTHTHSHYFMLCIFQNMTNSNCHRFVFHIVFRFEEMRNPHRHTWKQEQNTALKRTVGKKKKTTKSWIVCLSARLHERSYSHSAAYKMSGFLAAISICCIQIIFKFLT